MNLLHHSCALPDAEPKLFQYDGPLDEVDPEIASIIRNEKNRQVGRACTPVPLPLALPNLTTCHATQCSTRTPGHAVRYK